ncbi:MAG TPA: ABC-2 transporter permease [Gammaproteobacteria bacterium]|nr:ABC-2 transporter permease [Gammaproteobacteria bacterium]
MRQLTTLIQRELIENRSSWLVTTVFGGLFVLAALLSVFGLVRVDAFSDPMTLAEIGERVDAVVLGEVLTVLLVAIAGVLSVVTALVVVFYFLDALYAERKDRSILFWKSLPVSDLKVVASKYLTGALTIPLLTVLVFIATAVLVSLVGSVALFRLGGGELLAAAPLAIGRVALFMLYLIACQVLWFAPVAGWLLLVSAFARRAVLGWAVLPPTLVVVAERILFGTRHALELIGHRLAGGFELAVQHAERRIIIADDAVMSAFPALADMLTPGRLLAAPSLWIGIAVGVAFFAGAVWLRRWRDET